MAVIKFSVSVFGKRGVNLKPLVRAIKDTGATFNNNIPSVHEDIYKITVDDLKKNYDSQGAFFGSKWARLKGTSIRPGGSKKILVQSGELRASVISSNSRHHKKIVTSSNVIIKSTLSVNGKNLAMIHQRGNKYLSSRKIYKESTFISKTGIRKVNVEYDKLMRLLKTKAETGK